MQSWLSGALEPCETDARKGRRARARSANVEWGCARARIAMPEGRRPLDRGGDLCRDEIALFAPPSNAHDAHVPRSGSTPPGRRSARASLALGDQPLSSAFTSSRRGPLCRATGARS